MAAHYRGQTILLAVQRVRGSRTRRVLAGWRAATAAAAVAAADAAADAAVSAAAERVEAAAASAVTVGIAVRRRGRAQHGLQCADVLRGVGAEQEAELGVLAAELGAEFSRWWPALRKQRCAHTACPPPPPPPPSTITTTACSPRTQCS